MRLVSGSDEFVLAFFKKYYNLFKGNLFFYLCNFHSFKTDIRPISRSYILLLSKTKTKRRSK